MCGILCCLSPTDEKLNSFSDRLEKMKNRGPDETVIKIVQSPNLTTFTCGFNRLAITDVLGGTQPIETDEWMCVHNGEFYTEANEWLNQASESDSHILTNMTVNNAMNFPTDLNGIFAYCSYNKETETLYVARDRFGVIPLYYVVERDTLATANDDQIYDRIWFASEAKALIGLGDINMFPPNTVMKVTLRNIRIQKETKDIHPPFSTDDYEELEMPCVKGIMGEGGVECNMLKKFYRAIEIRYQDEVPWACAFSGGLDSTFVASVLKGYESSEGYIEGADNVPTFSIGLPNSKELEVARRIANPLGRHHSIEVTVEEALEVIPDVIWALETYDVTTIRAGVMNYLLAKNMKKFGIKVVYSGEGSDELFGGYLYFHHCPSPEAMQQELIRKLNELCYYDCLRCNKAFAAWGIECRVPFLDKDFSNYIMKLNPVHKLSSTHPDGKQQEKKILRDRLQFHLKHVNFDIDWGDTDLFCYRQKDQFSDSVGKEWIEGLIQEAEKCVTDVELTEAEKIYPFQTPKTKEAYRYRKIFEDLFLCSGEHFVKYDNNTVACSTSVGAEWCKNVQKDPSGNYVKQSIKGNKI